ncbi:MAG TPA: ABC transporter ATP-binding protein [Candidatus Krumholzibacteria bacterium]|nr:ABC transporter ATP-binding protein [Candidatus Krumholzibacteria bacterium]
MIEVTGLTKHFGPRTAVDEVSFSIGQGEIVGFLGPNGAGKTTTLRMLTGFLPPSVGSARVAGFDVDTQSMQVRSHIGYLPETVPIYRDLTVAYYLDFVGRLKGMPRARRRERTAEVIHACGIEDVFQQRIGTLSRGYRQRVGLAQALLNDPEVLFLDEPTVGLDPRQIVEIRDLIRSLAGRRTVVLSTHILPEVSLLCRRVLIIHRGRLIADARPEELQSHTGDALRVDVEARGELAAVRAAIESVEGVASVAGLDSAIAGIVRLRVAADSGADPREAIAATLAARNIGLRSLVTASVTLEDVFVQLVTREN